MFGNDLRGVFQRAQIGKEIEQTITRNLVDTARGKFLSHAIRPDLVELVQRDQRRVVIFQWDSGNSEDPCQSSPVIEPHTKVVEAKFRQNFTRGRTNLCFNNHRARSEHVYVALVKLSKPS